MASQESGVTNIQDDISANEIEDFPTYAFLSSSQINTLLEEQDVDEIQRIMKEFLNFKDLQTNLKEAILVDYYVSGFCWGKDMNFNVLQLTGLMGLLHFLMENIETKQMSLEETIIEVGRALTGIGHSSLKTTGRLTFFNVDQAKDIINYFKISLFQHYKLYAYMFTVPRDQMVIGAEQVIEIAKPAETPFPTPLEEGIYSEIYTKFIAPPIPKEDTENTKDATQPEEPDKSENVSVEDDPLSGYTIEEANTVLNQATADAIGGLQAEINEKLRVQEEVFTAKIENLKKP